MPQGAALKSIIEDPGSSILRIFSHEELILTMKNQDPVLKKIFTKQNMRVLISFLVSQPQVDEQAIAYKMPVAAMEILCCESHFILELLFQAHEPTPHGQYSQTEHQAQSEQQTQAGQQISAEQQPQYPLIEYLLSFMDHAEDYYMAGLFNKVLGSLTKRVFSPTHKFNQILCELVFGKSRYLFKALNHIYSESMVELIVRWLTLKSRDTAYLQVKFDFLEIVLGLMNLPSSSAPPETLLKNFFSSSLESVVTLVGMLLKSKPDSPSESAQPLEHKNVGLMINKNTQKELYQLMTQPKLVHAALNPVPEARLEKLGLVKKILQIYRSEREQTRKNEQKNHEELRLSECVSEQILVECMGWICENLTRLVTQNEATANKKKVILYLEILLQFHLQAEDLREPLTFYYEQNQKEHIEMIVKLLELKNNIIQNLLSKVMMIVLEKLNCVDFETALLHEGLASTIDQEGIREHVLEWAKVIMRRQSSREHIYEDAAEEAKWDHMAQVIANAEDIKLGRYRFRPSHMDVFYSYQKAIDFYASFLKEPVQVQYEQKSLLRKAQSIKGTRAAEEPDSGSQRQLVHAAEPNIGTQSEVDSDPVANTQTDKAEVTLPSEGHGQPGQSAEGKGRQARASNWDSDEAVKVDVLGLDSIRQGYMSFPVELLFEQLEL